ncbi:hypothetical protein KGF54_001803 [Candida jiufengensis]|uniref:uncharacterized protein n=1 Tax=Candida jiufengensis TaxID=497108 RepID=UPI00222436C5|nr:uncharacterized protein KGF54_001803 [Candida jiufengensis]KAI5955242.1 hypothetical protein KGF54_001803 [Candida jiufengensis]
MNSSPSSSILTTSLSKKSSSLSNNQQQQQQQNPILARYLNTPINFKIAKNQENLNNLNQLPTNYIILSKNKNYNNFNKQMQQNGEVKNGSINNKKFDKSLNSLNRPKSIAEAVAQYTGNKYETKSKSNRKKRKLEQLQQQEQQEQTLPKNKNKRLKVSSKYSSEEEDEIDIEISEDNDNSDNNEIAGEEEVIDDDFSRNKNIQHQDKKPKSLWGSFKSILFNGMNSQNDTEEDLGEDLEEELIEDDQTEEQIEDNRVINNDQVFQSLLKVGKEEQESTSSGSSPGEIFSENSPFTGFSEAEKSEDNDEEYNEDDEEEGEDENSLSSDDESYNEEDLKAEEKDLEEESKENTPIVETEEDEDLNINKLRHDLKMDELLNGSNSAKFSSSNEDDSKEDDDEEEDIYEDNKSNDRKSITSRKSNSTPPTSPEEDVNISIKDNTDNESMKSFSTTTTDDLSNFYKINELNSDRGSNGSKRIYKNWRELKDQKPPIGLLNHGVTCYMNSAIQSLIHIPAMQHYLNDVYNDTLTNNGKLTTNYIKPRSITHALAELSKKMWNPVPTNLKNGYINPKKIITRLDEINCMMSEWQQEDSHEYYMSLISRLQEDSTPKGTKLNKSIIYDIFGGLLNQKITCMRCNNESITKQEFYDLSLGLNKKKYKNNYKFSIEKSIFDFFNNEILKIQENDKKSGYYCETCKKFTSANKKSTIERSPEILTIHLKRFKFNGNSSSKVKQSINYSEYLNLNKYLLDPNEQAQYQLISVIVHEGRSISSGHYITHVLQPNGVDWCTYDDEYINKIDEKKAFSDPNAYVLIYTKLTPK